MAADEYASLSLRINRLNKKLNEVATRDQDCVRLKSIPGIGSINATAIVSAIADGYQFNNAREFAVWLGLTPRQASSGERSASFGITKRGNRYLRTQLVHGARALLFRTRHRDDHLSLWTQELVQRRGVHKATVALAAKLARRCWTLLDKQQHYITNYSATKTV